MRRSWRSCTDGVKLTPFYTLLRWSPIHRRKVGHTEQLVGDAELPAPMPGGPSKLVDWVAGHSCTRCRQAQARVQQQISRCPWVALSHDHARGGRGEPNCPRKRYAPVGPVLEALDIGQVESSSNTAPPQLAYTPGQAVLHLATDETRGLHEHPGWCHAGYCPLASSSSINHAAHTEPQPGPATQARYII